MLHKISQMCDKIDSIKVDADRLRKLKYGDNPGTTADIDNLIAQIQSDCYLISQDRSPYAKSTEKDNI